MPNENIGFSSLVECLTSSRTFQIEVRGKEVYGLEGLLHLYRYRLMGVAQTFYQHRVLFEEYHDTLSRVMLVLVYTQPLSLEVRR